MAGIIAKSRLVISKMAEAGGRGTFCGIFIVCGFLFALSGCGPEEQVPEIVRGPTYPPKAMPPKPPVAKPRPSGGYSEWQPPSFCEKGWTAIIVHHSGTKSGNAATIDDWHKNGRHWDGIGYDFVVGNGTGSRDGQIEVTFRWQKQIPGAHCGGTANNWANKDGIGICLIGDFNSSPPTPRQMESLVELVRYLKGRYNISKDRIFGHNSTPGGHATDCPGKSFPMWYLKSRL